MFSSLHAHYHEEGIVDMDSCLWRPIVVTVSGDRTLHVWDYLAKNLLLYHTFREDVFSISLHPNGKIIRAKYIFNYYKNKILDLRSRILTI